MCNEFLKEYNFVVSERCVLWGCDVLPWLGCGQRGFARGSEHAALIGEDKSMQLVRGP